MASRGPLDSLHLLWALRGRDRIASIGAVITVLVIASDAFGQEIVRYYPCSFSTPSAQASIPRTNIYSDQTFLETTNSTTCPIGLQAAMGAGLYNSVLMQNAGRYESAEFNVPFRCPTGQCSFLENYHSIAYCSSCVDISSQVTVTPLKAITANVSALEAQFYPYLAYNFTLPSGLSMFVNNMMKGLPQMSVRNNEWLWFNTGIFVQPFYTSDPCPQWGCSGYGAASCLIVPCIKTYNSSVNQGLLTETWQESYSPVQDDGQVSSGLTSDAVLNVDCLSEAERLVVTRAGVSIPRETKWLPYSLDFNDLDWYPGPLIASISTRCIYRMTGLVSAAVQKFAMSYFDGDLIPPVGADDAEILFGEQWGATGPTQLEVLNANPSFEAICDTMRNVTKAMTNYVRQSSWESVPGQVTHAVTCVNIRYEWLIFPCVLVLSMIGFLVSTLWKTRKSEHRHHDWKSSPLALIYHGLEDDVLERKSSHHLDRTSAMKENAGLLHVQITRTEKGWRFVEV